MKTTIRVTRRRRHIKDGTKANPFCCPIALAVTELMLEGTEVRVSKAGMVVENLFSSDTLIPIPRAAQKFIGRFDECLSVKPFAFKL